MTGIATVRQNGTRLMLAVRLGGAGYALPVESVEEVLPELPVEPIPRAPEFVRGVVFVRGHLIPVISGTVRLGLPALSSESDPHLVCLRVRGGLIGLEVDEALDLIEVSEAGALTPSRFGGQDDFLQGMVDQAGQLIRILDPESLLPGFGELLTAEVR